MSENSIILEWLNRQYTLVFENGELVKSTIEQFNAHPSGYNPIHQKAYDVFSNNYGIPYSNETLAALEEAAKKATFAEPESVCKRNLTTAETQTLIKTLQATFTGESRENISARNMAELRVSGTVPNYSVMTLPAQSSGDAYYTAAQEGESYIGELEPTKIPFKPVSGAYKEAAQDLESIVCKR